MIALLALGGISWQFHLNASDPALADIGTRAWQMAMYFTNITNAIVGASMLWLVFGKRISANFLATITLAIVMVGIIYKILLAPEVPKLSPDWYPDFFVHVAVPVLMALWWAVWGNKDLRLSALPIWLSLPALYCAYALVRGAITGVYPYFFFDISTFGLARVLLNCAGLVFVFGLVGTVLWAVSRLIRQTVLIK